MKLTVEELSVLKPGRKLWLYDNRKGDADPVPVVLRVVDDKYRFYLHIVNNDEGYVDAFYWSMVTNAPLKEAIMPINQKVWLSLRD